MLYIQLILLLSMGTIHKIKELRKQKGYSQKEMAEKLNISTSGYGKIEIGENVLSVERLQDICRILGVTSYNQVLPAINDDSVNEIQKVLLTAGMAFDSIHHNTMYLNRLIESLNEKYKNQEPEKNEDIRKDLELIADYLKTINSESVKNRYNLVSMRELIKLID